ncbi:MAG TPA: S53 family peptidase [Tepidisphaeraceae bacterium]|nr:S53 family peptidase [Tepidisphaeraceae bacterium]
MATHQSSNSKVHEPIGQAQHATGPSGWTAHPIAISHRLSGSGAQQLGAAGPQSGTTTPDQMRGAYGLGPYGASSVAFGSVQGDGSGQTIAIIDAYDDPNAFTDLNTFSSAFGLPTFATPTNPVAGSPTFAKVNQSGASTPLPAGDASHGWDVEESLDIEWAHVMAPKANILLVEASSNGWGDLIQSAVGWASAAPGVSAVSMSFGGGEFSFENSATSGYDKYFTTPANHNGVTFLAATGDSGSPGDYPAYSPNVVAVGGTSIHVDSNNGWSAENGWISSGGGVSSYEAQPAYQKGKVNGASSTKRTIPDVSIEADPSTGVAICDSAAYGVSTPWLSGFIEGGTSLATPMWAGLIAVANQGRVLAGQGTLDGPSQTLPALYNLPASDFHDITSDTSSPPNALSAGYDLLTGRGSPVANRLIPDLASAGPTLKSTQIADGNKQRSIVRSLTFTFDHPVTLAAGAVTLSQWNTGNSGLNDGSAPSDASVALGSPVSSDGGLTWVVPILTNTAFSDASGSLVDGIYTSTVHAGLVTDVFSHHLLGGDQATTFHRLFGDIDGNRRVTSFDYQAFVAAFGSAPGSPSYLSYFDFGGHGLPVNSVDYFQFSARFGKSFIYTA